MLTYNNQGKRIPMRVIAFKTNRTKSARRGHPTIPKGTILYALEYTIHGGYFTYSYTTLERAREIAKNFGQYRTDTEFYREWNVVKDKQDTLHAN